MALVFRQNAPPDGTTTARLALLGRERTPARPGGNSRYTCTGWHYPAPGGAIVHAASRNGNPPGTSVLLGLTIDPSWGRLAILPSFGGAAGTAYFSGRSSLPPSP